MCMQLVRCGRPACTHAASAYTLPHTAPRRRCAGGACSTGCCHARRRRLGCCSRLRCGVTVGLGGTAGSNSGRCAEGELGSASLPASQSRLHTAPPPQHTRVCDALAPCHSSKQKKGGKSPAKAAARRPSKAAEPKRKRPAADDRCADELLASGGDGMAGWHVAGATAACSAGQTVKSVHTLALCSHTCTPCLECRACRATPGRPPTAAMMRRRSSSPQPRSP